MEQAPRERTAYRPRWGKGISGSSNLQKSTLSSYSYTPLLAVKLTEGCLCMRNYHSERITILHQKDSDIFLLPFYYHERFLEGKNPGFMQLPAFLVVAGQRDWFCFRANPLSSSLRVPFAPSSMETVEKHPINPAFLRGADRLKDRMRTLRWRARSSFSMSLGPNSFALFRINLFAPRHWLSRGKKIYSNSKANPLSSSFVSCFCPKLHGEGGGTPHKSSVYAGIGSSERQNEDPALTRKVLVSYVVGAKLICPF